MASCILGIEREAETHFSQRFILLSAFEQDERQGRVAFLLFRCQLDDLARGTLGFVEIAGLQQQFGEIRVANPELVGACDGFAHVGDGFVRAALIACDEATHRIGP